MEPSRFDELTKALATATSRRQALKTIAATTFGGILGLSGIGTAFAAKTCKQLGQGCNSKKNLCCPGLICDPTTGTCACPSGQTDCSGTCVDTQNDPNNCGGCGNVCSQGLVCQNGTCGIPCIASGGPCNQIMPDCCSGLCCGSTCCSSGQLCDTANSTCVSCIPIDDSGCSTPFDCCDFGTGVTCCNGTCQMVCV